MGEPSGAEHVLGAGERVSCGCDGRALQPDGEWLQVDGSAEAGEKCVQLVERLSHGDRLWRVEVQRTDVWSWRVEVQRTDVWSWRVEVQRTDVWSWRVEVQRTDVWS